MTMKTWLKRKLTGRHQSLSKAQAERIARLPKDQARRELGALLFEIGVRHATEFMQDELRRLESPFRGVPLTAVFHEMLAVTFWIMDNEMAGGKKTLVPELHDHYFRSYSLTGVTPEERRKAIEEKYRQYAGEWDDHTGHQDEFGLCVAQNIFGTEASDRTRERTFWIIKYAHDVASDLAPLKKQYRSKFRADAPAPGEQ